MHVRRAGRLSVGWPHRQANCSSAQLLAGPLLLREGEGVTGNRFLLPPLWPRGSGSRGGRAWRGSVKFPLIIILILISQPSGSPCLLHRLSSGVHGAGVGLEKNTCRRVSLYPGFAGRLLTCPGDFGPCRTERNGDAGAALLALRSPPSLPRWPPSGVAHCGSPGILAVPARSPWPPHPLEEPRSELLRPLRGMSISRRPGAVHHGAASLSRRQDSDGCWSWASACWA